MKPLEVKFLGGDGGAWSVDRIVAVRGPSLSQAARLAIMEGPSTAAFTQGAAWVLRGVTGPESYALPAEIAALTALQAPLGRASATSAALIPVRKSAEWWALPRKERRAIFEERSHHIARSLSYLPRIARRLHRCRELGESFDFVTWFEFAPADGEAFEELVGVLRTTEEWSYVEREVDIRLTLLSW